MAIDLNDPSMAGYLPLEEFRAKDAPSSSRRVREKTDQSPVTYAEMTEKIEQEVADSFDDMVLATEDTPDTDATKLSTPIDTIRRLAKRWLSPRSAMSVSVSNDALVRAAGWQSLGDTGVLRDYVLEVSEPTWFDKIKIGLKWFRGSEQRPRIVIGEEYLTRLYEDIEASANGGGGTLINGVMGGNSIMARGAEGAQTVEIFSRILADKGFSQFGLTNYAVPGTTWGDLVVSSLGIGPHVAVVFLLFDTNCINFYTPTQHYEVMAGKIAEIRAAHGNVNKLSIVVIGSPSTNAKADPDFLSRDYRKYEQLRRGKEKLCREYQVCFVDLYNWMPDSRWMATKDMDDVPAAYDPDVPMSGNPVHPKHKLAVRHFGKVLDAIMPRSSVSGWASNRFINVPGSAGLVEEGAPPTSFDKGMTVYRTTAGPVNGSRLTIRHVDGPSLQINNSHQTGVLRMPARSADVSNNNWKPWTGEERQIQLHNSWVPYGEGSPIPTAWYEAGGTVFVQMHIKSGSTAHGTHLGTLPPWLAPATPQVRVFESDKRVRFWPSSAITVDTPNWTNENVVISTFFPMA